MDFRLDDDQLALQETIGRFAADRFALDRVAEREGRPTDRAVWRELGDLGVFGVMTPVDHGGVGLGPVEAAIVFEQLGLHLVTGPALWSTLLAGLVDGAARGERLVTGIDVAPAPGEPILVEHGDEADVLVVLGPDGVHAADLAGAVREDAGDAPPLDPLTPVTVLAELPAGERIGDRADADRLRLLGTVLSAALLVGVSDTATTVARDYALEREQFGVPIGSFQALKHLMADMFVRTALARSATYAAAASIPTGHDGDGDGDLDAAVRAAHAAKLLAAEAARANGRGAVQVLGGMGFTWEMLPHYLLKRAWVVETSFGTADEHALALGDLVGADVRAARAVAS